MKTMPERGGYSRGVVRLNGSFRIDGTNNPDVIRDGKSELITSVVRESAGLFTVTLSSTAVLPSLLTSWKISMARAAVPTQEISECNLVVDSYSQSAGTFQIACVDGADGSNGAVDPDDNDMIAFELVGSQTSAGQDSA